MRTKRFTLRRPLSCIIALGLLALSCSSEKKLPELYPVHGKVLFKDKPAEGVGLTFHPQMETDLRPGAISEADGSFTVTTDGSPGAPAGDYTVTMYWSSDKSQPNGNKAGEVSISISMGKSAVDPVDKLKGKFSNRATSPFKAKVEKGNNELPPFKLN
jgi:hypothetical protein